MIALALVLAGATFVAVPLRAAEPIVAERPDWKAGDAWRYRSTDERSGITSTFWWSVIAVRADGGYSAIVGTRPQERDANMELEPADGPGYKEQWEHWPLRIGERWSYERPVKLDAGNGTAVTTREVSSAERVEVPAGVFDCLRIEATKKQMTYDPRESSRSSYSSQWDTTDWYCPAIRHFAKRVIVWRDGYGKMSRTEVILLNYHLAR